MIKLFVSQDHDWYVVAKKTQLDDSVNVLYEGHNKEQAYEAILEYIGMTFRALEMDMSDGAWMPKASDFE